MPDLLTVAELAEHVPSSLGATAMGRLLDDLEEEIEAAVGGPVTPSRVDLISGDGTESILLRTRAGAISQVRERGIGEPWVLLLPSSYRLVHGGNTLERVDGVRWGEEVEITLTARDRGRWRLALIDLVKIELGHSGLEARAIGGDYTEGQYIPLPEKKRKILDRLRPRGGVFVR
jgi:hypothetical protein